MNHRDKRFLTAIALAGSLFCLLSALGITDTLCLTHGCEVYRGYTVAGISLYWVGVAVFLVLGLMSSWSRSCRLLAIFTGLALVGDFVFLIIQLLLWPCTSCLVVAALLGSFAWCLARHVNSGLRILCFVWMVLFSANLLFLARDSIPPWPVMGKKNAEIQVFFSPTCPACRQVVEILLHRSDLLPDIAFYPLAKDDNDIGRIRLLNENLSKGMLPSEAFAVHWQRIPHEDTRTRDWHIAFNLWRNQIFFAKKGATQVPLIISPAPIGETPDKGVSHQEGCSVFSPGSEACDDLPTTDSFDMLFK